MLLILGIQLAGINPHSLRNIVSLKPAFSSGSIPQFSATAQEFEKSYGPINPNWELKRLGSTTKTLQQFEGKVVFLNMWATWCGPCIREIPEIQKLMQKLEGEVVFLFVTTEEEEVVSNFVASNSYTQISFEGLPIYVSEDEPPRQIYTHVWPTTYILDKTGKVRYRHSGIAKWGEAEVVSYLESLLAEAT